MLTKYQPYANPALDARLTSMSEQAAGKAAIGWKTMGAKNQPLPVGDSFAPYYEPYHLDHQLIIDFLASEINPDAIRLRVLDATATAQQEQQQLTNTINTIDKKLATIVSNLGLLTKPRRRAWRVYVILAVLCAFDGGFAIPIFEGLGSTYIEALGWATGYTVVLTAYAHFIPAFIRLGKTALQQKIIIAGLILFTFILFLAVANARSIYLTKTIGPGVGDSLMFVLFSWLFFAIAAIIAKEKLPTPEERKAAQAYDDLVKEQQQLLKERAAAKAEYNRIGADIAALRANNARILEYGRIKEEEIITHSRRTFSEFKTECLSYRTDHLKPDCLPEPYPFPFKRYFIFNHQSNDNYTEYQ